MIRPAPLLRSLALAAALLAALAADAAAQTIWRGRSGGFDITWSVDDVAARRVSDGALVLSLKRRFEKEWDRPRGEDENEVRDVYQAFRALSVVGSVISLEEAWYCDCGGAHPIAYAGFVAYDLARSTLDAPDTASITRLVDEAPLVRALSADRVIRAVLDSAEVREAGTLAALLDSVQWIGVPVETPLEAQECWYSMSDGFPGHFALHHLEGDQVAVRFSMSHDVELCRGRMIQVGVLVPVPPRLRSDLAAAEGRTAGFLMKDARGIARDRWTTFKWEPKRPGGGR
jgi:hypothetical protein